MDNSSPKLLSATLSDHEALGVGGDPIYRAAEQIRTLLHKELGGSVSQIFSIPVRNDKTNQIDWYGSTEGDIKKFNDLTPEEQVSIKEEVAQCFKKIDAFRDRLLNEVGTETAKTYASLLDAAKSYPSDDQIFIIDGKPVITFWGFKESLLSRAGGVKAQIGAPVVPAILGAAVVPPILGELPSQVGENSVGTSASIAQPTEPTKSIWQRFGWWAVLLILLLLGIPAVMKSCSNDFPLYKKEINKSNCPDVSNPPTPSKAECTPDVAVVPPAEKVPEPQPAPVPAPDPQVLSKQALEKNDLSVFEGKWVLTSQLYVIGTREKLAIDLNLGKGGKGVARRAYSSTVCTGSALVTIKGVKNFVVNVGQMNCNPNGRWGADIFNCAVRPNQIQADCSLTCTTDSGDSTYICNSVFEKR